MVLLRICLYFDQFQHGVTYKNVAYKKKPVQQKAYSASSKIVCINNFILKACGCLLMGTWYQLSVVAIKHNSKVQYSFWKYVTAC